MPAKKSTADHAPSLLARLRATVGARTWLWMAAAFVAGLLLFVLVWMKQRAQNDFFRVDEPQTSASGRELAPLPGPDTGRIATDTAPAAAKPTAPSPAGTDDGLPAPLPEDSAASASGDAAPIADGAPAQGARPDLAPIDPVAATNEDDSDPVPTRSPSPRYPAAALRRGDGGEVVLRVHVGRDGVPMRIDLVSGSGSALLDRAATEAVRDWRFRPAMRAGQAVEGNVQVPIRFNPRG